MDPPTEEEVKRMIEEDDARIQAIRVAMLSWKDD
jgi:hypothetical protein